MVVSGAEGEVSVSKVDPCGISFLRLWEVLNIFNLNCLWLYLGGPKIIKFRLFTSFGSNRN